MGGMHSRGIGVEIVALPIEEEEDEMGYIREMIRHRAATGATATLPNKGKQDRRYGDEDNGRVGLFSLSNQPGWQQLWPIQQTNHSCQYRPKSSP